MAMPSKEDRIKAARERTQHNVETKNSFGVQGKRPIDLEKIGGYKKEMFYRPKPGINHLDFVPYVVNEDRHPQKVRPGYPDYILDLFVHRSVGAAKDTFLCLTQMYGKPCPICEAREMLKLDPDSTKEEIKALYPKRRCWYNVINLDSKEKNPPVQIFEESHYLFETELLEFINNKNAFEFWDIEAGSSLEFFATENKSEAGNHMKYKQFHLDPRQPYGEDIYKEAYNLSDLLYIPTYEEVRNAYLGLSDDEEMPAKPDSSERSRGRTENPAEEAPSRNRGRNIQDEIAEEKDPIAEGAADSRRRDRGRTEAPAESEEKLCSLGHKFGIENQKFPKDCAACPAKEYNDCADKYDEINAKG